MEQVEAEYAGLLAFGRICQVDVARTATFAVPVPLGLCHCPGVGTALLLPWLGLQKPRSFEAHGAAVGALHRRSLGRSEAYGFTCDTFCGRWRQANQWSHDWVTFFWFQRLEPLLRAAAAAAGCGPHAAGPAVSALLGLGAEALRPLFDGADLRPCLLHGDLWRGNFWLQEDGRPVLLDPAACWGHAELDLASVRLLEGEEASASFLQGYWSEMPQAPGLHLRAGLYALCPALRLWATFPGQGSAAAAHRDRGEELATAVLRNLARCSSEGLPAGSLADNEA